MPGWRRRIRCRRQEVATMTMVSCVAVLCLYSLALTWCLAQPHLAPGEVGGTTLDGSPQHHHPPSPVITARKLHFDAAGAPRSSNINDGSLLSSSLLSSSSSSSSQKGGQMSAGGANSVQRHHRTLQFSRSGKDGWDNNAGGVVESVGSRTHKGVRTMRQKRTRAAESPRKADISSSSAIYVEESEDSGEDGWGGTQEYRDGDSDVASGGSRRLPGAIIIGVKKAGTRALLEFLRLHPDVQAPGPEPHFFDRNYNRGLEWYKSLMPLSQEGQLTMEKTPSYFITREVPKRVQSMSRHVKLLVVVRDPVTRAISDYVQATSKREGRMKRFEDLALLDHRLGIVNTSWGAIRIGVYTKHLEKWFKYFPRRQFHFVSGEQLIANPAQVMQEVQQFLGLSPFITDKHFYLNATRGFPCLIKYPENKSKPHCLGKTKGRRHPDVDPHVIERLRDFYRPFNAKLYQMVGRDFGWS